MGDERGPGPVSPEQLAAFRRKIEDLELLGVETAPLEAVLKERPQDFEREAEAALRRELQSGLGEQGAQTQIVSAAPPEAPPFGPPAAGPAAAEAAAPAAGPAAPNAPAATPEPAPWPAAEGAATPTAATPTGLGGLPAPAPAAAAESPPGPAAPAAAVPPSDDLEAMAAAVAAIVAEAPPPPIGPAPAVLETPPGSEPGVEAALEEELREALAETSGAPSAAPGSLDAPPLADGGSLSLGDAQGSAADHTVVFSATSPVTTPSVRRAKPPPPSAAAGRAVRPQRVSLKAPPSPVLLPPGAKPAPAGAPGTPAAPEVLPTEQGSPRRFRTAALAVLVVAALFGITYFLLLNGPPAAAFSFSPTAPLAGDPVFFTANATTDPNGDPITFVWEFGDGGNATGPTARHTYTHSGAYAVNLSASDDHKNTGRASEVVKVTAGTIQPPPYRYGDSLDYTVTGTSRVEGSPPGTWLTSVSYTLAGSASQSTCGVTSVDLAYSGPQTRRVQDAPQNVKDGFLDSIDTFVVERSLPSLRLSGTINLTGCLKAAVGFAGTSTLLEDDFENLENNDTVRSESVENTDVTVSDTDPPKEYQSTAHLTDYPSLANASLQLRLESIYAGRAFSTEDFASGSFVAQGLHWSWLTQGTELVAGALTVKVHLVPTDAPPRILAFSIDLWVSSSSSLPLKEAYNVRGVDVGQLYESHFTATASGPATTGAADIPYGNGSRAYSTVAPSELSPLTEVPRSSAGANFAFTARTAFDEAVAANPDFANFTADNPQAYSVNGTYSTLTGNPRWALDFAADASGERWHVEDEHSGSAQLRFTAGTVGADRTRGEVGAVVSMDYAADLLRREASASALFPTGGFDAAHANFSIRQDLKLPTVSFNSAASATREAVPFAFGVESFDSQPTRIDAYVDARTGQLVFSLTSTGDSLP